MSTIKSSLPVVFDIIEEDLLNAGQVMQSERQDRPDPEGLEFPTAAVTERPPPIPVLEALASTTPPSCKGCRETSDVRDETLLEWPAPGEAARPRGCLDRAWDLVIM